MPDPVSTPSATILSVREPASATAPIQIQGPRDLLIRLAATLAWEKAQYRRDFQTVDDATRLATQLADAAGGPPWRISSACAIGIRAGFRRDEQPKLTVSFTNEAESSPSIRLECFDLLNEHLSSNKG